MSKEDTRKALTYYPEIMAWLQEIGCTVEEIEGIELSSEPIRDYTREEKEREQGIGGWKCYTPGPIIVTFTVTGNRKHSQSFNGLTYAPLDGAYVHRVVFE